MPPEPSTEATESPLAVRTGKVTISAQILGDVGGGYEEPRRAGDSHDAFALGSSEVTVQGWQHVRARARLEEVMKEFDHEKLDVYIAAIDFVAPADDVVEHLPRGRACLADQLQRAGTSVPHLAMLVQMVRRASESGTGTK